MRTLEEEFRDSDDDWHGLAYGHDRKDADSIRAYLQHHAKCIPPGHVIVGITIVMRASYQPRSVHTPFLRVMHFDAGDSTDPPSMFRKGLDDGTIELKQTVIQCDNNLFLAFSDFVIELTARGYDVEPPSET
jgi:hypothetical protein